ncbi:MAG: type IV pilus twitching motility protein PilT [Chloroflexi bacterium]|nr:type IV pilus twitching motility protein PilT [Chloroflexota bacterium]
MRLDDILRLAVTKRASDVHLSVGSPPILRINGVLQPISEEDIPAAQDAEQGSYPTDQALLTPLAGQDPGETEAELHVPLNPEDVERVLRALVDDTRWEMFLRDKELDFSYAVPGLARVRINACFERGNISMACRLLPFQILTIEELGLPPVCKDLVARPRGLVLVTGPTGSGKSTTLAAMISHLNETLSRRIVTIEDPIEFVYENKKSVIIQRELGSDTHSFQQALKHVLRQDPNVILIGEMRDPETISIALTAAETGHLILSTVHTVGAAETVDRIVDVFSSGSQPQIRVQLSMVLEGVISQALLPRADGQGRVAAFEVMIANNAIRNLIREGKAFQIASFLQMGKQQGMQTLDQSLLDLVKSGVVKREDALAKAVHATQLTRDMEGVLT